MVVPEIVLYSTLDSVELYIMQHNDYRAYFEFLATNNLALAHTSASPKFFYGSPELFLEQTTFHNNRNRAVLFVEDYELMADDSVSNNINWVYKGNFAVLRYAGSVSVKYEDEQQILHENRVIVEQIIARIYYDHTQFINNRSVQFAIRDFTPESVVIKKIDSQLADGYCGWLCEFEFTSERLNLDKTLWEDLD